jgi:hypothetical protein
MVGWFPVGALLHQLSFVHSSMQGTLTSTPPIGALFARNTRLHSRQNRKCFRKMPLSLVLKGTRMPQSNARTFLLTKVEASEPMKAKSSEEGREDHIKIWKDCCENSRPDLQTTYLWILSCAEAAVGCKSWLLLWYLNYQSMMSSMKLISWCMEA